MTSKQEILLRRGGGAVFTVWLIGGPIVGAIQPWHLSWGQVLLSWYMLLPLVGLLTIVGGAVVFTAVAGIYVEAFKPKKKIRAERRAERIAALEKELLQEKE